MIYSVLGIPRAGRWVSREERPRGLAHQLLRRWYEELSGPALIAFLESTFRLSAWIRIEFGTVASIRPEISHGEEGRDADSHLTGTRRDLSGLLDH